MQKIKIGVLGVSNHFLKRIVLPLQQTQYCEIVGIASRNEAKAKSVASDYNIQKSYSSYQSLLDDDDIDMVYIPLPNHMHAEWIKKAAKAGKHILCEKPLTLDAKEAEDAISEVKNCHVNLMEAFMYKFHPLWIHVKNIIKTNQIGQLKYIHTSFSYNNPQSSNIRNIKEYGGGAIMDIGCYAISVPRHLLNKEPIRVISVCEKNPDFKTDVLSTSILDFGSCRATFNVSTLSYGNQGVEIIGTSGMIKITIPFNTYVDTESEILVSTPQGNRVVHFDICDQYGLMFEAYSKALIEKSEPPYSPSDAIRNMKVIDAIFKSAETETWELIK